MNSTTPTNPPKGSRLPAKFNKFVSPKMQATITSSPIVIAWADKATDAFYETMYGPSSEKLAQYKLLAEKYNWPRCGLRHQAFVEKKNSSLDKFFVKKLTGRAKFLDTFLSFNKCSGCGQPLSTPVLDRVAYEQAVKDAQTATDSTTTVHRRQE